MPDVSLCGDLLYLLAGLLHGKGALVPNAGNGFAHTNHMLCH
jgi:hypothetical protein